MDYLITENGHIDYRAAAILGAITVMINVSLYRQHQLIFKVYTILDRCRGLQSLLSPAKPYPGTMVLQRHPCSIHLQQLEGR